jgi:hypothetical protein
MAVDMNHIKQLNERAKVLNDTRSRTLGAVEQAKKEFDKQVAKYQEMFGVTLTAENLQTEYANESTRLEQQATLLQSQVESIESGAYKNQAPVVNTGVTDIQIPVPKQTENLGMPDVQTTAPVEQPAPEPPAPVFAPPQSNTFTQMEAAVVPKDVAPVPAPAPMPIPGAGLNLPGFAASLPQTSAPMSVAQTPELDSQDISEQPFTPPNWGVQQVEGGTSVGGAAPVKFGG